MKTVYFVRHGETIANRDKYFQTKDTPLSEAGHAQALVIAERFTRIPIDAIISSDMERAHRTAQAIATTTGLMVVLEDSFRELKRPTELHGVQHDDQKALDILHVIRKNFSEGTRFSDEETFYDLKDRAQKALRYIQSRKEYSLAIVTHGTILKMMVACMAFGDHLTAKEYLSIEALLVPSNTGITKCELDGSVWNLLTWNDHAHLG